MANNKNLLKGKETEFTSKDQPSPEAKSEGLKKWHIRKKLKDELFEALNKKLKTSTGNVQTFQAWADKLVKDTLSKESELSSKEQNDLIIKVLDYLSVKEISNDINLMGIIKNDGTLIIDGEDMSED